MKKYKPIYVQAGKLDNGTYGIVRTCGDMVIIYNTEKEAKEDDRSFIVVDIGLIVDMGLMEGGLEKKFLDIRERRVKFGLTKK